MVGDPMTIQQLRYIVSVVENGTITEAAKKLYISQPSLSNAIKDIEEEVGHHHLYPQPRRHRRHA